MAEKRNEEVLEQVSGENSDMTNEVKGNLEEKHFTEEAYGDKWYDKKLIKGLPPYSNSMVQIVILSFIVFLTPGMYNALSGIGAGGISDISVADNSSVALYSTFATVGFFAGTICNIFGVRICLAFGGTGYLVYSASLLCFYHVENAGFVIFAGAYLGVCAACLWAAQGSILLSYPVEAKKGRAIMVFWVIFNLGAVIGSCIPLANNIANKGSSVNDGTYIAFICLMGAGSIVAFAMLPINKVWKSDGTRVLVEKFPDWRKELIDLWLILKNEPKILFLFPMFFASNWFYTYQFNDFNAGRFNIRTRSLNSLLYWLAQMFGAVIFGFLLDLKYFRRSVRAKIAFVVLFLVGMAIWGGGLKFQLEFTRESVLEEATIDYKDGKYIGPMFLYIFYGIFDAIYQNFVLWTLGALSNSPKKTSLYAGFYKGIQSAGAAIAWRLDALEKPYMDLFASSWGLVGGSMLIALPLIWFKIDDTSENENEFALETIVLNEVRSLAATTEV